MNSESDTHRWVGCPIRISTDQRLLAAPHGFSQRATSFIASWCQGIHRMPFSRSRSSEPPSGHPNGGPAHHAQKPPDTARSPPTPPSVPATAGHSALNTPLNATTRCRQAETCRSDTCTRSRPETHQTLIHPDKDHRSGPSPEPPTSSPSPFKGPEPNLLPATERKPIRSRPAQPNGPIWWRRLIWWR